MIQPFLAPASIQTWSPGRLQVRCVGCVQETADVRSFHFIAEPARLFLYKPGQFITLELDIDGARVARSYTLSSSPSTPYRLSITVKRVPGGQVSNWLHDHLHPGMTLDIQGPAGQFNAVDIRADKLLLLSGGVGITPLMSMARWFHDTCSDVDLVFAHSARSPADLIYRHELEQMAASASRFALHLLCDNHAPGQSWAGYRGRLNPTVLELLAPDFRERELLCCGPPAYMQCVRELLQASGYDLTRYHEEAFFAEPPPCATPDVQVDAANAPRIQFSLSGKEITAAPGETVHSAALRAGIRIPKACGMGVCGTCMVLKTAGEVRMQHDGGITDEDVAAGYILSCCSVPLQDMAIDC